MPSYGCALLILQTCVVCFAIYLVTSWKNDLDYSEKEPSECYIILSRHSKILFPSKPIVRCIGWIDKVYSRCTIWCIIFLIKPFKVHVFLWCTLAPKVFTRYMKKRGAQKIVHQNFKFFQPWKSMLNDDRFLPNLIFLLLGRKRTWPFITHHGQNTLVKIPDTTEVIFNLFCSDNNDLHFEYYITWKAFKFSSFTVKQKLCRHHAT